MPILKQLVSGSSQTKRRSRARPYHRDDQRPRWGTSATPCTWGRGGDTFGDTSFLSSRSGEPPRAGDITPHSPRPSLLSRTFRSSKRSQSVTRVDRCENLLAPLAGSPDPREKRLLPAAPQRRGRGEGTGCAQKSLLQPRGSAPLRRTAGLLTGLRPWTQNRWSGASGS
ncbi:hypothetical protein SKAU_G00301380 [Synaphobranchus kaupii]|uniref:Uncharacterized protein n=1 Tax=Synaphobranchus kaupii TaxID=118154 RepID=A0A9Q1EVR1_SYNKA|nr:hypothetical protein SKAU_G00301380 [Synaphobranchus kaupii]